MIQATFDKQIDTSGLMCPQPLLQAKQAMKTLTIGQTLLVISTDPSSVLDFSVYVKVAGHVLLKSYVKEEKYYFLIQKGS